MSGSSRREGAWDISHSTAHASTMSTHRRSNLSRTSNTHLAKPNNHLATSNNHIGTPNTHLGAPDKTSTFNTKSLGDRIAETRPVSPQESLRTMIHLDTPHDSDDDPDVSPLSDERPSTRSGSVLARFFPELSSNFQVVSPVSAEQKMRSVDFPSLFETELGERVQSLCTSPSSATDREKRAGRAGSSPVSDEIFDCASSCYSRRSSVTSIGTEWAGESSPYKSADAYSILNPVSAGVFDDAASVCPSRAPSVVLRQPDGQTNEVLPSMYDSVVSKMSMDELKNKPLPLEPISEPSPLTIRRPDIRESTQRSHSASPPKTTASRYMSRQRDESCRECGGHREHSYCPGRRPGWHEHTHGHRLRHVPTLSQAAEELEYALADLARDPNMKQRTLLVLDGPLQISRHHGDLVATRPAPQPPSTKPHSQSPRSGKDGHLRSMKTSRVAETQMERRLDHLRFLRSSPPKQKEPKPERSKSPKFPESKGHRHTQSSSSEDKKDKGKIKKSFTLFGRKDDRRVSVLSTRSETSLDPHEQDPRHPSRSSSWDLAPSNASSKRDDLLCQLPRLQTQDLDFKKLLDSLKLDGVARSASASPTRQPLGVSDDAQHQHSPEIHLSPPEEEKILACDRMRQTHAFVSTAQASSVQLPPEQVYELAADPSSPSEVQPPIMMNKDNPILANLNFPSTMPEDVIVSIMENIGSLDDLFNFVLVNKRFYVVFKKRELPLIKNALYQMSAPAWELREMSPPWANEAQFLPDPDSQVPEYTPTLYLGRYAQDIYTLARLKSMILVRCSPFLRRDTLRGLSGVDPVRAEEVDDAFWRIWTFCRIFGSGKGREADLEGQMDWLKGGVKARSSSGAAPTMTEPFGMNNVLFEPPQGFALGNRGGLSQKQMYDMTEIWTCLAVLLQGLHGKCKEARDVGIFDGMNLQPGDTTREETALGKCQPFVGRQRRLTRYTEEWTSYVLTLGLSAVLTLSSLCPAEATAETFEKAKAAGLTKWELTETETTRSSFLKEAISRVYEEQERALSINSDSPTDLLARETELANAEAERAREERHRAFKLELRARRLHGATSDRDIGSSFASERPMSEFSMIVRNLDGSIRHPSTYTRTSTADTTPPVPPVPALTLDRTSTSTTSTNPQCTPLHTPPPPPAPSSNHSSTTSIPLPLPRSPPLHPTLAPPPLRPQVQDPVDRAIAHMVHDLGFDENDVKWALKITDTGEGIDVQAAERLLKQQKRKNLHNPFAPRGKDSLLHSVMKRQGSQDSGWRWA